MISVAELKAHLNVDHASDDVLLANLEASAVGFVETSTGRYFGPVGEHTAYIPGTGTGALWLPVEPATVVSVHSAIYAGETPTEIVEADDDGFVLRGMRLLRKGSHYWSAGYEYTVVYTAGYEPSAEPEEIRAIVRDLVALWYTHRTPSKERSEGEDAILRSLRRHRVPVVA